MPGWKDIGNASEYIRTDGFSPREYQFNIINSIIDNGNTLVVLPTGLGKTLIGAAIIANALSKGKKALLLAPTKPLAEQHYSTLSSMLVIPKEKILLLVGSISKSKRRENEQHADVIIATPQTVSNDLKEGSLTLNDFGAAIFDECHRAVGKYAYTYIANECAVLDVLIVGLTASPGGKKERIKALVDALNIKHIEARVSSDPDVKKYVMQNNIHVIDVDKSERIIQISKLLTPGIEHSMTSLKKMGLMKFKSFERMPKGMLIQLGNDISKIEAQNYKFAAIFSYTRLLNLIHAYDLLMTEGIYPFSKYFDSLAAREKKSRSVETLLADANIVNARKLADEALKHGEEHPKVMALLDVIRLYKDKNAIVFAQYRSTVKMLVEYLRNNGFSAEPFVGKKDGITQEMQKSTINNFREKKFNVLVASSIGEEGLDIPNVDVVVFYEPIPNEIRDIQRRGRTGRFRTGEVYVLMTKGTKDEVYLYISRQRERKMLTLIKDINKKLNWQSNNKQWEQKKL
ncbi:MAG: DEAD/DEAH box helicase family protein [Candidatus Marsarchaeota archaeon]|jgi:Fanconi anemia group M protein|nr:DEAD/DEAH box helicase family protein [Candidatus Marsarchaeota archaeon]